MRLWHSKDEYSYCAHTLRFGNHNVWLLPRPLQMRPCPWSPMPLVIACAGRQYDVFWSLKERPSQVHNAYGDCQLCRYIFKFMSVLWHQSTETGTTLKIIPPDMPYHLKKIQKDVLCFGTKQRIQHAWIGAWIMLSLCPTVCELLNWGYRYDKIKAGKPTVAQLRQQHCFDSWAGPLHVCTHLLKNNEVGY